MAQKSFKNLVRLAGVLVIVGLILVSFSVSRFLGEVTEFSPAPYDKPFPHNPYKGWVAWGKSPYFEEYSQPYSMLFVIVSWRQIEPERNQFAWEAFEKYWHFETLEGNQKIVLRVVLDYPNDEGVLDIPDWLYQKINRKGTHYIRNKSVKGFSPDYSNPVLIAEHKRLMAKLGERYNGDPRIAFIQAGSIGHWGEWHTHPIGSGEFPAYEEAEQYLHHYLESFPDKMILLRRPLQWMLQDERIGLYNDSMAHDETFKWLDWIWKGYTSEWDGGTHPALNKDWWHRRGSAGEFYSHRDGIQYWVTGERFGITLDQIRQSHTSWIGPHSAGRIANSADYQKEFDQILKTLGYRYEIENVRYRKNVLAGFGVRLDLTIENTGVAPIYYDWPLEVSLVNRAGEVVFKETVSSVEITRWLPGENEVSFEIMLPPSLQSDDYKIAIAIKDPENPGAPGIDFAIDQNLRQPGGQYLLGEVSVLQLKDLLLKWLR